jgi:hypothetical protein
MNANNGLEPDHFPDRLSVLSTRYCKVVQCLRRFHDPVARQFTHNLALVSRQIVNLAFSINAGEQAAGKVAEHTLLKRSEFRGGDGDRQH